MKKFLSIVIAVLIMLITSCASTDQEKERTFPRNVQKALMEAEKIAVLGYNTSKGLDDRLLDDAVSSGFGFSISVEEKVKFPIAERVDAYDEDLRTKLQQAPLKLIPKEEVLASTAYQRIKGDPNLDLSNVNAADGYTLTYEFANFMDTSSKDRVPLPGNIVNSFKGTLEDIGADLGIIVVQKPWVRVRTYALIPDRLFKRKKNYFAVGTTAYYYIVRPTVGNQVIYKSGMYSESETKYLLKGYDANQLKTDEKTFLDQLDAVVEKSHDQFMKMLLSATQE